MPIYEYRCSACDETNEVWAKISDPPPRECPSCGEADTMRKLISLSSFQLRGSGWYADGYGKGAKPKKPDNGDQAGTSTDGASAKKAPGGDATSTSDTGSSSSSKIDAKGSAPSAASPG